MSKLKIDAKPWTSTKLLNLLLIACLVQFLGCNAAEQSSIQGYVEGEYLYLATPQAGYLKSLNTTRGSRVTSGQVVFVVSDEPDDQALLEAESRAESAKQKLRNLIEPKRRSEIAELQAKLKEAQAHLQLTEVELKQQEHLARRRLTAQLNVDQARSAQQQAVARIAAVNEQIATYKNTLGRQAEIQAAESDLAAAQAQIEQKRWIVEHKTVTAPAIGEINDTYYRPGEWVPAGAPVASLLPDDRRRLRFFIPEKLLASINLGDTVEASCDGCSTPIRAQVDFISPEAEYTPPVIYSVGSREKLVFRIEAAPPIEQARALHPGLPVDIQLAR